MNKKWHLALDLGPLAAFFVTYRLAGLLAATATLIAATLCSLVFVYAKEKRIALMPLVSGIVITVFGGLTLILHDEFFIKIKPTLINLIFASILLGGLILRKNVLQYLFADALHMREEGWRKLSLRWGLFFIFLAALNEIIWRNFSTDFWVNFKVFGMLTCSILFTASQLPLIQKYWLEEEK